MNLVAPVSALCARVRRVPLEWVPALLFSCVGLGVIFFAPTDWAAPDVQLYRQLAAAFISGFVVMISAACGHALLLSVPEASRSRWRDGCLALAGVIGLAAYLFVKAPQSIAILRLLEAAALGGFLVVAALGVFLPVAGILRWRNFVRVAGRFAALWTPVILFNVFTGFCLTASMIASPLVWDPVLLRMDLSLGINPSRIAYGWSDLQPWLYPLSDATYPLLGLMIAGVVARLQIAQEFSQARRALFAVLLVGVLGLGSYQLVPAVGPIHAFPALYAEYENPARAAVALERALDGPGRIAGAPGLARNVMPSLHTAFTLVVLAAAWSWRRRFFWQCLPLGFFQIATTLTLAVHYLVDLIAAVPFAAFCWWLADRGVRRTPTAGVAPLPPLACEGKVLVRRTRVFTGVLAGSVGGLLAWAWFAPVHPALAWALTVFCVAAPAWAGLRLNRHARTERSGRCADNPVAPPVAWRVRWVDAAVFTSGGVALGLGQIFAMYHSTQFGAGGQARLTVPVVSFAGLALGAWLGPRGAAGARRRLVALEWFVAGWAVLFGAMFFKFDRVLCGLLAEAGVSAFTFEGVRLIVTILWILPPAFALGARLPAFAALFSGAQQGSGRGFSRLLVLHLAGALVFALAAPALLFDAAGADGALWFLAALGGVVGCALWLGLSASAACSGPATVSRTGEAGVGVFAAGFAFAALGVVWFHLGRTVLGASVSGFSPVLAVVLLGLALGGAWGRRRPAGELPVFGPMAGWLAVALAIGGALWPWAGFLMAREQAVQGFEWVWAGEAIKVGIIAIILLPAVVVTGAAFGAWVRRVEADGARSVGAFFACKLAGGAAGALAAGFVFIPVLGAERTLQMMAVLAAGAGLWMGLRRRVRWSALVPVAGGLAVLVCVPVWNRLELTAGYGWHLRPQLAPGAGLTFFREDFSAGFVTVVEEDGVTRAAPVKTLLHNGAIAADDADDMPAQIGYGLVAALYAPANGRALVIGAGSGQAASVIARLGFDPVDIAETSAACIEAARAEFGHINARVFERANVSVNIEDGRSLLLRTRERHDMIQIGVSAAWTEGAADFYSREFYALARERLSPGGVLVQWIRLDHLAVREVACVLATARAEFGNVSVWRFGGAACLLASDREPVPNEAVWRTWKTAPDLFEELLTTGFGKPEAFAARRMLSGAGVDALLARTHAGVNTDANRRLEFQAAKHALSTRDHTAENLRWLAERK